MHDPSAVTTFLFTDIEGSTRLWDQDHERMRLALARHDAIVRSAIEDHRGLVVKMSGDGAHAAFADPLDALAATLALQQALDDPAATGGVSVRVRCGLHAGVSERRDSDFFGGTVNRAARIMSAAHGGQVLVSQAVALLIGERLPTGVGLRDLGTARLRDLASPERVFQVLHPRLRQDFPALRSLEATPNNLPQQLSSFIGRERELAETRKLLAGTRLLTLLGVGGIGKTRLSLQLAAEVIDDYPDGVWLVELAPLADGRLVPQAVASVLGVKDDAGRSVVEALAAYVAGRRMLVILDNCEHVARAAAELAKRLLQSGPQMTILASSREPLHLPGETGYPVPALTVPDPLRPTAPGAFRSFEAVRLFIERASAARPGFEIGAEHEAAIAGICRRLDGIPLAIELAAARVRGLTVEAIAARLSDRFRLLTGGDRTALPRQQTLHALIDWSYELLTAHERVMLQRLSVFSGGWTLEAAEAVAGGDDIAQAEVADLLTRLVEKSLVALERGGERYDLLETVREFARDRLRESGHEEHGRTKHLGYYLALAEKARPGLSGPDQATWLARLDRERENLLAAHAWADRAEGGAELGLRLVYAMKPYWLNRGLLGLGARITEEALARPGAQERSPARCGGLADAGQLSFYLGRYAEARAYLEQALSIARELDDRRRIAAVLQPLGMACLGLNEVTTARSHLEEALALAQTLGNKRELAAAINALAQLHRMQGAAEAAQPLYEQVVELARELRDRESIAVGLLNLAMLSIDRDMSERARTLLVEVLAIARAIGSKPAGQSVLEVSAGLASTRREWRSSALFFGAAEAQAERTGLRRDPADEAFLAPLIAATRAALGADSFADVGAEGAALGYDQAMEAVGDWLAAAPDRPKT